MPPCLLQQDPPPPLLDISRKQDPATIDFLSELRPSKTWEAKLLSLLQRHPKAVVGEFGLDRAAVIPGTKVRCRTKGYGMPSPTG